MQILVDAGWSRTLADNQDRTSLVLAPPVQEGAPWSLQYAAGRHQTSVVAMLLNMRADANAPGSEGNRALEISCLQGDAEVKRLLLEHGADPRLRHKAGGTPLHDAALKGNKAVIELLVAQGADVNLKNAEPLTALEEARKNRFDDVSRFLSSIATKP